jgi:hypothetical protein
MLLFKKTKSKKKDCEGKKRDSVFSQMYKNEILYYIVDDYLTSCSAVANGSKDETSFRHMAKHRSHFPNLAGLCRYVGVGMSELTVFSKEYPDEYDKLLAILEDEALNSDLSPTILSAYLKKRLSYVKDTEFAENAKEVRFCFEHDIFADGE